MFCNTITNVEDMSSHGRACPPRRLQLLRESHHPEGLKCGGQGECGLLRGCLWGEILGETLLPIMPTQVEQYVQEWIQSAIDGGDQYTSNKGFRRLTYYAPALVAGVWSQSWNSSTARAGPTVREMCAMFELLPAPHQGNMARMLEERLQLAIGQDKDTTEYHQSVLDTVPKQGSLFVLSTLSPNLWRDLKRRVFQDPRPCSTGHLDLFMYALEHSFIRPTAAWTPKMLTQFCQQAALTMDTFARWIYKLFTSSSGMMLLGQSTLEWRNRCMAMESFPLPKANTPAATNYGVKHAVATLLALVDPVELLDAFPTNGNVAAHMFHVINCFISAMMDYMQDVDVLERMASTVVVAIICREPEMKLIMPPVIAIHIPVTGVMTDQLLNLCVQSHRFMIIHRFINYYWVKSFLGYLIVMLRCKDFDPLVVVHRLARDLVQTSMVRGMTLIQAVSGDLFDPLSSDAEEGPMVSRLHIQLVLLLLCLMDSNPLGCVIEAIQWVVQHPLGVQMARSKDTRPLLRMALAKSQLCLKSMPLLGSAQTLRFMLRVSRYLPIALECIIEEDVQLWTRDLIETVCDDGRLVDVVVWRCMFLPHAPREAIQFLLDDVRYRRRDWVIPLRLHSCVRDTRPNTRTSPPLSQLVSIDPPTMQDFGEGVLRVAIMANAHGNDLGGRWWRAATRIQPVGQHDAKGWLLQRMRMFAEINMDGTSHEILTPHLEMALTQNLMGNPDTLTVANCFWFLIMYGTDSGLSVSAHVWIRAHPCSWVSVIRESMDTFFSALHTLQVRCMRSAEVQSTAGSLLMVLCQGQQPTELLARMDFLAISQSMSHFQLELFLSSALDKQQHNVWAAMLKGNPAELASWAQSMLPLHGFGPLEDVMFHLSQPETSGTSTTVLQVIVDIMHAVMTTSSRLQSFEHQYVSHLVVFVASVRCYLHLLKNTLLTSHFVKLFRKEYDQLMPLWDVMVAFHHAHLSEVPGREVAGLLQVVRDEQDHFVEMTKFLTKWIQAMGSAAAAEWATDMDMYDAEVADLFSQTHKRCASTAVEFVRVMGAARILRDDSTLALVVRVVCQ